MSGAAGAGAAAVPGDAGIRPAREAGGPPPAAIRPASDADLAELAAVFGPARIAALLDRQRRGAGVVLVAWSGGHPAGVAHLREEPAEDPEVRLRLPAMPALEHVEVAPAHRGQGLGTALVRAVERAARDRGHAWLTAGVGLDNPGAVRLLTRLGYDDLDDDVFAGVRHQLVRSLDPSVPGIGAWDAWHPLEAARRLSGVDAPWHVVGGWSVDLWLGRQTRTHSDLEIAVPRPYLPRMRAHLAGFELFVAGNGRVVPLSRDGNVPADHHQIWVLERAAPALEPAQPAQPAWRMDLMLEPGDASEWVFRRDERVRRPYPEMVGVTAQGVPYLRPEGTLLFKAKARRAKDEADFAAARPRLEPAARAWLAGAIALVHPGHPWLVALKDAMIL